MLLGISIPISCSSNEAVNIIFWHMKQKTEEDNATSKLVKDTIFNWSRGHIVFTYQI